MFKLSHTTLIVISGAIWMAVGCFLLPLGLNLLVGGIVPEQLRQGAEYPLVDVLAPFFGARENSILVLIVFGLYVGYLKGRHVLGKSARRGIARIQAFPNPTSLANIYAWPYYLLLALMVGLGMSIKYLGIPNDIRGVVDITIGAALINGAMIYFRSCRSTCDTSSL